VPLYTLKKLHAILCTYIIYNNCTPLITTPDSGEQY
jgi:hypothetical protein